MSTAPPKLVSTLVTPGAYLGAMIAAGGLILAMGGDRTALFLVVLGLFRALEGIRTASTRVTTGGVTQLTWRGRVTLAWDDVTVATRNSRSLTLSSPKGSVRIPVECFEYTDEAVRYIEAHLPDSVVWRG